MSDVRDPQAAAKLLTAGQAGYDAYPNDCSHSIWSMLHQLGLNEPYRVANDVMGHLARKGSGWREVTVAEAGELANAGKVVIGGLAVPGGHGHVVMVMPGALRASGGYRVGIGKKARAIARSGAYPPSASGAMGAWPGAKSRGEKTVRDPWSADDFSKVTFWTKN